MKSIWPPISAAPAGPAPLYGTCTSFVPVICWNSTPARWFALPLPEEPKVTSPGRDRASAMNSFSVFTGTDGWVDR